MQNITAVSIISIVISGLGFLIAFFNYYRQHIQVRHQLIYNYTSLKDYELGVHLQASFILSNTGNREIYIIKTCFSTVSLDGQETHHNTNNEEQDKIGVVKPGEMKRITLIFANAPLINENDALLDKNGRSYEVFLELTVILSNGKRMQITIPQYSIRIPFDKPYQTSFNHYFHEASGKDLLQSRFAQKSIW